MQYIAVIYGGLNNQLVCVQIGHNLIACHPNLQPRMELEEPRSGLRVCLDAAKQPKLLEK